MVSKLSRREKDEPSLLGAQEPGGKDIGAPSLGNSKAPLEGPCRAWGSSVGRWEATETRSLLVPTSQLFSLSSSLCAVRGQGPADSTASLPGGSVGLCQQGTATLGEGLGTLSFLFAVSSSIASRLKMCLHPDSSGGRVLTLPAPRTSLTVPTQRDSTAHKDPSSGL